MDSVRPLTRGTASYIVFKDLKRASRMCGICGIAGVRGRTNDGDALIERARDTLTHRGPDDSGSWYSPDGMVALAMRRLAIVDLSDCGHQPMHGAPGERDVTLVFNGEIYNHRELRDELSGLGHSFRGHSDTEVVIASYLRWGARCLVRLVGMFAFGLYDPQSDELFLARDRAGEKPLFYHHTEGRFSFASELSSLMADKRLNRRLDVLAMNHFLAFGYAPSDRAMLEGVRKLPPAHALVYDLRRDRIRTWSYWTLPERPIPEDGDPVELVAELEQLLGTAVRDQMQADVPVSIMLSGGTDSSLVAAMAARTTPQVRTFTITMPTRDSYDEGPAARRIASYLGSQHTELEAEPASVALLPELARRLSEPIADSSIVPTYLLSRLISGHAKVALGGDGGDELFGGYPHHMWAIQHEFLRHATQGPAGALARLAVSRIPMGMKGRNYLVALSSNQRTAAGTTGQYFSAEWRGRLSPLLGALSPDELAAPELYKGLLSLPRASALQQITAIDFQTYLSEDVLAKVDRASMLASLEVRSPWLDWRVIEFAFSRVPDHLRATSRRGKILPRMLAARLFPDALTSNRKQGFSIPLHAWFKGEWGSFMEGILNEAPKELFDQASIAELVKLQRSGYSNTHRLFTLTMLELWRREFGIALPG